MQLPKMCSCVGLCGVALAPIRWSANPTNPGSVAPSCPATNRTAYLNRIADALGTDLDPEMPAKPEGWG